MDGKAGGRSDFDEGVVGRSPVTDAVFLADGLLQAVCEVYRFVVKEVAQFGFVDVAGVVDAVHREDSDVGEGVGDDVGEEEGREAIAFHHVDHAVAGGVPVRAGATSEGVAFAGFPEVFHLEIEGDGEEGAFVVALPFQDFFVQGADVVLGGRERRGFLSFSCRGQAWRVCQRVERVGLP